MLPWKAVNSSEGISKGEGGVALCARECFDYLELNNCDDGVEALDLVLVRDFNLPDVCWDITAQGVSGACGR